MGFQEVLVVETLTVSTGVCKDGVQYLGREDPREEEAQVTSKFLPGESQNRRGAIVGL